MSEEVIIENEAEIDPKKNIKLLKLFFQVLGLFAGLISLGVIVYIIIVYGFDPFEALSSGTLPGYTIGVFGIPVFGVAVISAIIAGIIDLRERSLKEEDELKEFKLAEEIADEWRNNYNWRKSCC